MAKRAEAGQSHKLKIRIDDLYTFEPLTDSQKIFFDLYNEGTQAIMLHGVAGTGKTFIALYKALEEVLDRGSTPDQVIIVRSAVQTRDIGHLPGDEAEKMEVYKRPYVCICDTLFGESRQAFDRLQEQGVVKFMTTSFIRGLTINNAVIIVDEAQNLNYQEINSIITRVGKNTKIIFCGDFRQTDLNKKGDMTGLTKFIEISNYMPSFRKVEFQPSDIVRSDLVKEFILASLHYDDKRIYETKSKF